MRKQRNLAIPGLPEVTLADHISLQYFTAKTAPTTATTTNFTWRRRRIHDNFADVLFSMFFRAVVTPLATQAQLLSCWLQPQDLNTPGQAKSQSVLNLPYSPMAP